MRLTPAQKEAILAAIHGKDPQAEVYLFGSRARDDLKGGDIDLLVLSETLDFSAKLDVLIAIKLRIGEQKIDLLIRSRAKAAADPFVQSILPGAVGLR